MSSQQNTSGQTTGDQNPSIPGPTSVAYCYGPFSTEALRLAAQAPFVPSAERVSPTTMSQPEHYVPIGNNNTRSLDEPDAHGAYPFHNQIAGIDAVRRALAQRDADHQEQLAADMQARQEQQAAESAKVAGSASASQGVPTEEEGGVDRARQALADVHEARGGSKKA